MEDYQSEDADALDMVVGRGKADGYGSARWRVHGRLGHEGIAREGTSGKRRAGQNVPDGKGEVIRGVHVKAG